MSEKKLKAGRFKGIIVLLLLFGPASLLVFISSRGCEHKFKELEILGDLPQYSFSTPSGAKKSSADFKGNVLLITTLQQTCPDSCATSFWHLDQMIYQHIKKNKKKLGHVKIVSFVTDGEGNPVQDLSNMEFVLKDRVQNYDPEIWILAAGDARKIYDFTRNGENLLQEGDEYFGGEAYQELMLLVDKSNKLRMVSKGNQEGLIRRMKEHMALLDKQYDKEAFNAKKKSN
jgi:cytochrome oxidase Cu insertion factor (SCO1/SenC/PrrC family)